MVDATTEVSTQQGPARVHLTPAKGEPRGSLLLTHGAGGGIGGVDLVAIEATLPQHGWQVVLVEMPWKVAGKKVAPMPPKLDAAWREIVPAVRGQLHERVVFGGRSAGARVSCRLAVEMGGGGRAGAELPAHPAGQGRGGFAHPRAGPAGRGGAAGAGRAGCPGCLRLAGEGPLPAAARARRPGGRGPRRAGAGRRGAGHPFLHRW
ncbi:hypothetical protein B277_10745 [Janibacter hoylei PVAS-1]|uniref:KANL3/Tex30 alpha/beta hydrolase-like domain-containing protein n=1 Tax=Janibacter hoylei PVAS-1 TaxID=1210046 RepID=K1ENM2_9MICO|nr:hypothetical protein B277_10745 [Janibacter hoylei PVAS-1]